MASASRRVAGRARPAIGATCAPGPTSGWSQRWPASAKLAIPKGYARWLPARLKPSWRGGAAGRRGGQSMGDVGARVVWHTATPEEHGCGLRDLTHVETVGAPS
jgi:hypothetical protein